MSRKHALNTTKKNVDYSLWDRYKVYPRNSLVAYNDNVYLLVREPHVVTSVVTPVTIQNHECKDDCCCCDSTYYWVKTDTPLQYPSTTTGVTYQNPEEDTAWIKVLTANTKNVVKVLDAFNNEVVLNVETTKE